jgi:hypothetical protein
MVIGKEKAGTSVIRIKFNKVLIDLAEKTTKATTK